MLCPAGDLMNWPNHAPLLCSLLTAVWLEKTNSGIFPAFIGYVIKMPSSPFRKGTERSSLLMRIPITFVELEL